MPDMCEVTLGTGCSTSTVGTVWGTAYDILDAWQCTRNLMRLGVIDRSDMIAKEFEIESCTWLPFRCVTTEQGLAKHRQSLDIVKGHGLTYPLHASCLPVKTIAKLSELSELLIASSDSTSS